MRLIETKWDKNGSLMGQSETKPILGGKMRLNGSFRRQINY